MDKKITRKEAIKKAGVTALAATSLVFLNTKANACASGGRIGGKPQVTNYSGDGDHHHHHHHHHHG